MMGEMVELSLSLPEATIPSLPTPTGNLMAESEAKAFFAQGSSRSR